MSRYIDHSQLGREIPLIIKDKNIGYIGGYEDGSFRPESHITREEVAKIIYFMAEDEFFDDIFIENNPFYDLDRSRWSYEYIVSLHQKNLYKGYIKNYFNPGQKITRGEVAVLIARAKGLKPINKNYFYDVLDHYGRDEINAVANKKWITGYNDGSFRPYENITRAEFVTIMNRALSRKARKNTENIFNDLDSNKWYFGEVLKAI